MPLAGFRFLGSFFNIFFRPTYPVSPAFSSQPRKILIKSHVGKCLSVDLRFSSLFHNENFFDFFIFSTEKWRFSYFFASIYLKAD